MTGNSRPALLHDCGDYPAWLDRVSYRCHGAPALAADVAARDFDAHAEYRRRAPHAHLSAPTADFLDPLFFVLGASLTGDRVMTLSKVSTPGRSRCVRACSQDAAAKISGRRTNSSGRRFVGL